MDFIKSVLIVGSGGREHAILKALLRSDIPLCIYAYPGNPGMANDGCTLIEKKIDGWDDLAQWAADNEIALTVVGPELPLVEGIVDVFTEKGLTIFGPSKAAARIEGSKEFAKNLMRKYRIPTASFAVFSDKVEALRHLDRTGVPVVIKASGLAGGKGAVVCETFDEASRTLSAMFDEKVFGDAARTVVLEEKMTGEEVSVFVLTDGNTYRILPLSQDHKRVGDGDTGPNTGGMGAYAPVPFVNETVIGQIERQIVVPTLAALRSEGMPYRGLLYVGIMLTAEGPRVVEYNCRFGDPETQAVLPLVRCNWYHLFSSCARGELASIRWEIAPYFCATVVLASRGYPGPYEKGKLITGIAEAERGKSNIDVYHGGTALDSCGRFVTNGGRVLSVSAWAATLEEAIHQAYGAADLINFEGKSMRRDIGARGLVWLAAAQRETAHSNNTHRAKTKTVSAVKRHRRLASTRRRKEASSPRRYSVGRHKTQQKRRKNNSRRGTR